MKKYDALMAEAIGQREPPEAPEASEPTEAKQRPSGTSSSSFYAHNYSSEASFTSPAPRDRWLFDTGADLHTVNDFKWFVKGKVWKLEGHTGHHGSRLSEP